MKKSVLGVLALAALAGAANGDVVISQVYGGGGNGGGIYSRDFVELHNNGSTAESIGGWSIQYASAAGNFGGSNSKVDIPAGATIPAGGYYLIALAQGANTNLDPLPTPDLDTPVSGAGTIAVSGTGAKIALVSSTTALPANSCPADPTIVDFLGWGGSANCAEGAPAPATANPTGVIRNNNGCQDTGNNASDFTIGTPSARNSASPAYACTGFADCNGNGVDDATDIANGTSQDCNADGVPDECQMSGRDCNGNGQLDECEIAANPALDCNGNGVLDTCDLASGLLTDVDGNGVPDSCEGAAVTETDVNATVTALGIRALSSGSDFMNIEGAGAGDNASYAAMRWDIANAVARFNADFGAGQWEITRAYLYLQQSNAAFTVDSLGDAMEVFYTNMDGVDIAPQSTINPALTFGNFASDWTDADLALTYTFTRGSIGTNGSGTVESYLLYDASGSNNSAMAATGAELDAASGSLTLLINTTDDFAAATYAGRTHFQWRGPTLVLFAQSNGTGPGCDGDVNCDGNLDGFDVQAMEQAIGGDMGNFCQADADFNHDGNLDGFDVQAVEAVTGGAPCP